MRFISVLGIFLNTMRFSPLVLAEQLVIVMWTKLIFRQVRPLLNGCMFALKTFLQAAPTGWGQIAQKHLQSLSLEIIIWVCWIFLSHVVIWYILYMFGFLVATSKYHQRRQSVCAASRLLHFQGSIRVYIGSLFWSMCVLNSKDSPEVLLMKIMAAGAWGSLSIRSWAQIIGFN